jgi:hypothetical protein
MQHIYEVRGFYGCFIITLRECCIVYIRDVTRYLCRKLHGNVLITYGPSLKKKIAHEVDSVAEEVIFPCWLKYFYIMVSVFNHRQKSLCNLVPA